MKTTVKKNAVRKAVPLKRTNAINVKAGSDKLAGCPVFHPAHGDGVIERVFEGVCSVNFDSNRCRTEFYYVDLMGGYCEWAINVDKLIKMKHQALVELGRMTEQVLIYKSGLECIKNLVLLKGDKPIPTV